MTAKRLRPEFSELAEPFDVPVRGLNPRDDEQLPAVPYIPFRCPFCGRHKPRTEGGPYGRKRRHKCMACGRRYLSIEMPASCLPGWPAIAADVPDD